MPVSRSSRRPGQHGRAALHDLEQERVTPVETAATELVGPALGAHDEGAVVRVGPQDQERRVRRRELQRAPGDQPQRVVLARPGQELVADLRRRLQPLLPQPALLEQVGVVHRDPGRRREGLDENLVVAGELPAAVLLGQVQVAEHRITDPDGHPEKGAHRRVVRREAHRCLVPAQVGQPQRALTEDELPEQPPAFGEAPHGRPRRLVQPHVDEPRDAAGRAEHAERPVPGVDEIDRGVHDPSQGGLQLETEATARTASSRPCIRPRVAMTSASRSCTSRSSSSSRRPDCTVDIGAARCSPSGTPIPCPAAGPLLAPTNSGSAWHGRRTRTTRRRPTPSQVRGGSGGAFRP